MSYPPISFKSKTERTYDLGKWFRELGSYGEWEANKLKEFAKEHVIVRVDPCETSTGGTVLLVDGYRRGDK